MTRLEFLDYASNQAGSFHDSYTEDKLNDWIRESYDGVINTEKIVGFFSGIGHLHFNRIETKSGDKLDIDLRWLSCIENWEDIGCAVNSIGFILNCSGRIEQLYISENGRFYNQNHKLIAESEEDFFDYLASVEYDFHPEIKQRTYDMLRFFGWYEGRHIDTTAFEQELNRRGIELSKEQLDFFGEFSGLYFTFDSNCWEFDPLEVILTKDEYYAEQSSNDEKNQYKIIYCGSTMGGPLAVDGDGIIQFFYAIPQGRTTMECINHLCESVHRDCKWIAPNQGNGEQNLDQC